MLSPGSINHFSYLKNIPPLDTSIKKEHNPMKTELIIGGLQ